MASYIPGVDDDALAPVGRHLVYRLTTKSKKVPDFVLFALEALVPEFSTVTVLARPDLSPAIREQLTQRTPLKHIRVEPFKHVSHCGQALLFTAKMLPDLDPIVVLDDSLIGPAGSIGEVLAALWELPGPVTSVFPLEKTSELSLRGGCLAVDSKWLGIPVVRRALSRRESKSWSGLGKSLRALTGNRVPVLLENSETGNLAPWLAGGLDKAMKEGVPFVPWRVFTADPLALASWDIDPTDAYRYLTASGLPDGLLWEHLLKTVEPQIWHANLRLLTVTDPHAPLAREPKAVGAPLNTAVLMHVFYDDMLADMVCYARNVPKPVTLFITTDTEKKASEFRRAVTKETHFDRVEVRVVKSNQGRDIPAFLIDCADVLADKSYDLVVKLHSKKSAQTPATTGQYFKDHLFQNLVGTASQAAQIKRLFESETRLGLVFPPMIHVSHPTMGNGWFTNKPPAFRVARRLGFVLHDRSSSFQANPRTAALPLVPIDPVSPLAPYGSMFWARRDALQPLLEAKFRYEDFPTNDAYVDGSLAHILERLTAYAVYFRGYYSRTVQTIESAEFTDAALLAKLGVIDQLLPLDPLRQRGAIQRGLPFSLERIGRHGYATLVRFSPSTGKLARRAWHSLKPVAATLGRRGAL